MLCLGRGADHIAPDVKVQIQSRARSRDMPKLHTHASYFRPAQPNLVYTLCSILKRIITDAVSH